AGPVPRSVRSTPACTSIARSARTPVVAVSRPAPSCLPRSADTAASARRRSPDRWSKLPLALWRSGVLSAEGDEGGVAPDGPLGDGARGAPRVDDRVAARVDPEVAGPHHEVTGLGLGLRDCGAGRDLLRRGAGQVDAGLCIRVGAQAGAVEADARLGGAPRVGGTDLAARGVDDRLLRVRRGVRGGGSRGPAARDRSAAAVQCTASLRPHDPVDLQIVRALEVLHGPMGELAELTVDGQRGTMLIERGL